MKCADVSSMATSASMKKFLFLVNVDWFFISHFLPVGLECLKRDYKVHIACGITDKKEYLENLGFIIHPISITRGGTNLKTELNTIFAIYDVIKIIKPEVLEFFTIKPVLYGGIVSKFFSIPKKVFYITGLGYVFIARGFKGFIIRNIVKTLYKLAISGRNNSVITENIYDKQLISSINAVNDCQINIIQGAGVDLSKYKYIEEDNQSIKVFMACRLLKDKGIFEFAEAAKQIIQRYPKVIFQLAGTIDPDNPTSITQQQLEQWQQTTFIQTLGQRNDIPNLFSQAHIVVLPSYREGFPKVLIEAAACGRAVITTDVPGCRDAIIPGQTGLLVPVRNAKALAEAIERLIVDKALRQQMGKAGRKLAEERYAIEQVVATHLAIYQELLDAK